MINFLFGFACALGLAIVYPKAFVAVQEFVKSGWAKLTAKSPE